MLPEGCHLLSGGSIFDICRSQRATHFPKLLSETISLLLQFELEMLQAFIKAYFCFRQEQMRRCGIECIPVNVSPRLKPISDVSVIGFFDALDVDNRLMFCDDPIGTFQDIHLHSLDVDFHHPDTLLENVAVKSADFDVP